LPSSVTTTLSTATRKEPKNQPTPAMPRISARKPARKELLAKLKAPARKPTPKANTSAKNKNPRVSPLNPTHKTASPVKPTPPNQRRAVTVLSTKVIQLVNTPRNTSRRVRIVAERVDKIRNQRRRSQSNPQRSPTRNTWNK
jgi:hypothetical protein